MDDTAKQTNVWEVLDKVKVNMKIGENAGRADQIYYQHLCEGMQKNDLNKMYETISAVERGCGITRDENMDKLIKKAYEENTGRLGEFIANRNNLLDYWMFLSYCTPEVIGQMILIETEYTLFYYECARLLFQEIKRDNSYRTYIVRAVKKIAMHDSELWERWLNKNEHNMTWQKMIGEVLAELTEEPLVVYANSIHLDMVVRKDELRIITESFHEITDDRFDYILSVISEDICQRWKNYVQTKKEQKKFQSGIMISAYTNIILWSMDVVMKKRYIWEKEFFTITKTLEHDMYEWFENESQMRNVFFVDMTQIFYLLHVKKYELSDMGTEVVLNAVSKIKILMKRLDRFWDRNNERKTELESLLNLI